MPEGAVTESGPTSGKLPASLVVVAVIFLIAGLHSAWWTYVFLSAGKFHLDFGVLLIGVGLGLLGLRAGWRICGLIFLVLGFVSLAVTGFGIVYHEVGTFHFYGVTLDQDQKVLWWIVLLMHVVVQSWMFFVLTRPRIRHLFLYRTVEPTPWEG